MANDGLKHVVHRRVHLERSQPERRRSKVGQYLEKKADYKKRAERYHVREKIIRELSSKTRFRNEDEFNFKMIHGRIGEEGQVILESEESSRKRKLSKKKKVKSELDSIDRNLFVLNHKQNSSNKKLEKLIASNPALVKYHTQTHIFFDSDGKHKDDFMTGDQQVLELSEAFDKGKELENIRNKLEDKRNLTVAKYKKRQVKRVRDSNSNFKVHEFVTERLK